ncbi:MAG: hypothetical protein KC589_09230 [Nanoarchaeota archaeon]|nr:hypothetical protein [Nanoarchaeota archaeon]
MSVIAKNKVDGRVRSFNDTTWKKLSNKAKSEWSIVPDEVNESKSETVEEEDKKEDEKKTENPKTSVDMNVADAVAIISGLESMDELKAFVKGDERKGVADAFGKKQEELIK